jgi:hypothetical protein
MPTITLDGKFYHAGIAGDPVVILAFFEEGPFEDWCRANAVFTTKMEHRDPSTGLDRLAIYVTEGAVPELDEGVSVRITIDTRSETRGNGIRILSVVKIVTPEFK